MKELRKWWIPSGESSEKVENGLKNDPIVEEDESAEDDLSTSSEGGDETATQSTNVLYCLLFLFFCFCQSLSNIE